MITTAYTSDTASTLCGAGISRYRFVHWLCDIVKNFMSDPRNIPDERLASLLFVQNGSGVDECRARFQVALPYSPDSRVAGTTPALLVSAGGVAYPVSPLINTYMNTAGCGTVSRRMQPKLLEGRIAAITESLDGTILLLDTIEDFMLFNKLPLERDGMVTQLTLKNLSEPQEIKAGEGANAKPLYQSVLSLSAVGSISWEQDTQGPVFRGVRPAYKAKE